MDFTSRDNIACSYCKEIIQVGSRRCPYCGSLVRQSEQVASVSPRADEIKVENFSSSEPTVDVENERENYTKVLVDSQTLVQPQEPENTLPLREFSQDAVKINTQRPLNPAPSFNSATLKGVKSKNSLSNGIKVFITVVTTTIPCLGQLVGVILAVLFLNSEEEDKRSFGTALLIASLVFFVISCIFTFIGILILTLYISPQG